MKISVNTQQQLYVIETSYGYSCHGWSQAAYEQERLVHWAREHGIPIEIAPIEDAGTPLWYEKFKALQAAVVKFCAEHGTRCLIMLHHDLRAFEGQRVKAVYEGRKIEGYVTKTTGPIPVLLVIPDTEDATAQEVIMPYDSIKQVKLIK